ncbi:D-aminoacyl-tRNA deacylase [Candidatus Marsarchaeota archaeon]|nr:D-aminoacyl-tRNA deacylase [Candidatus Marsarchaeota archaeon]
MPFIVYSESNQTSKNIADALKGSWDFEESDAIGGFMHFKSDIVDMLAVTGSILETDFIDEIITTDFVIFPCSHRSVKGIASFTVHSEGNWSGEAKLGGKPKELAVAAPDRMLAVLKNMAGGNKTALPVIYEATHHGPLLNTPSFFVEVGGSPDALKSKAYAKFTAESILTALDAKPQFKDCVLGIGGLHYSQKFTRIALDAGRAFSHIMPKHYVAETDMLSKAIERSSIRVEKALIEWKSIKSLDRNNIISELNKLGMDYERV